MVITLPDGREVVVTSRPGCYGTSSVVVTRPGCGVVGAGLIRTREQLETLLAGHLRGVLASRCLTCGRIYALRLGTSEVGAISDGWCSDECVPPEW